MFSDYMKSNRKGDSVEWIKQSTKYQRILLKKLLEVMIVKRKGFIALLLALVMVVGLFAGCSQTKETPAEDSKPAESTDAPKEDTTPTEDPAPTSDAAWDTSKQDEIIVTVINGYYTAGEKKLAEEYMKLHPETKVTIDVIADNNSYTTKMQTILSSTDGSNTPDIVHSNFLGDVVGGAASALEQGYLMDMSTVLDMEHPYQDGLVRDMYDETVLTEAKNGSGGTAMQALPFDKCGISFFYNKTAFEALNLSAPETWEELLEVCQAFRDNGVQNPITVSSEASWIMASLADAGIRGQEYDFLIQPGDALWDEATMAANKNFVFDESNLTCDAFTVQSDERIAMAKHDGIIFSDVSKTAWTEFAKLARYFPENYLSSGADTVTEFEMQISPMLLSGSWNVGLLLDDLNQMPADKQFDWATFNIPGFANAPNGFGAEMRGLYVLGNVMGIVAKDDPDHQARVLDFYLYWYSQAGAQLCYEETLSNGNYVQGPSMIKGVTLSDTLNEKLAGFIVEGPVKQFCSQLVGMNETTEADRGIHNDLLNQLIAGSIDLDAFLERLNEIQQNYVASQQETSGWDYDPAT